jgi:hypothetical protein
MDISNNGSNWTEVDRRVDNSDLNGNGLIGTYSISGQVPESRFVSMRQIGKRRSGNDSLVASDFELFGTLPPS